MNGWNALKKKRKFLAVVDNKRLTARARAIAARKELLKAERELALIDAELAQIDAEIAGEEGA
jgi:hypothetical protein